MAGERGSWVGPAPSRRAILGGGLALALTGCTSGGDTGLPGRSRPSLDPDEAVGSSPSPTPVDPDDAVRSAAVARERSLLAAYENVEGVDAALVAGLRAQHAQHLDALLDGAPAAVESASPAGTSASSPSTAAARGPDELVGLERAAAAAHGEAAVAARSRSLAGLLASLAASEASHPVALA